jgi:hypothetical protein
MIPDRLIDILRRCETDEGTPFPPTGIFNEGWMLRLVLDAVQNLKLRNQPLSFLEGSRWYSEALLSSPFRPRTKGDTLSEGFTNADAVIGDFEFRATTKAGLWLRPGCRQFVVAEAKMFSNLSAGTKNAPTYNQAARNVACMAAAIAQASRSSVDFDSVGFFVIAPRTDRRRPGFSNLERSVDPDAIRVAVDERIGAYHAAGRDEVSELRDWERTHFLPLVNQLAENGRLGVLSWEDCIEQIERADPAARAELAQFYEKCLSYAPRALAS